MDLHVPALMYLDVFCPESPVVVPRCIEGNFCRWGRQSPVEVALDVNLVVGVHAHEDLASLPWRAEESPVDESSGDIHQDGPISGVEVKR